MPEIVIADTSCLIVLDNIGELDLLEKLYGAVFITPEVAWEYGEAIPVWFNIRTVENVIKKEAFERIVDVGEASSLALALELSESIIILDDIKARKLAILNGIKITGTLGVIAKAKRKGIITEIKPFLINYSRQIFGFHRN